MYSFNLQEKDEGLVRQYVESANRDSFEELCRRYIVPLYRYSMTFVKNKDEAEDIVQQTFIKMWKNIRTFDQNKKFSVWIYTIARRTALDELKKKRFFPFSQLSKEEDLPFEDTLADPAAFTERMLESVRDVDAFEQILNGMPQDKSEILFLKLYEDMTFDEISVTVGRPMNTVKSIYRRSLEVVRTELEQKYNVVAPKVVI